MKKTLKYLITILLVLTLLITVIHSTSYRFGLAEVEFKVLNQNLEYEKVSNYFVVEDKVYALMKNNKVEKDIFQIPLYITKDSYYDEYGASVTEDKENVYIVLEGTNYLNNDGGQGNSKPEVYKVNKSDNSVDKIDIKDKKNVVITDYFFAGKELNIVFEKNITKIRNIGSFFESFSNKRQETTGMINDNVLETPIIGNLPYERKGVSDNGYYYYCGFDGIYKYNLKNKVNKRVLEEDFSKCFNAYIIKKGSSFILIKDYSNKNILLNTLELYFDSNFYDNRTTEIIKYDNNFKELQRKSIAGGTSSYSFGENGAVLNTIITPEEPLDDDDLGEEIYRYIDFEKFTVKDLGSSREGEIIYIYNPDTKEFVQYNYKKNKVVGILGE